MFDFTPTEEQEALRAMVREFLAIEVKPKAPGFDADNRHPIFPEMIASIDEVLIRTRATRFANT